MPISKKNQKGFTLIELLVVVVVIGALSGIVLSMINSGGFRDKARDSQRIADLKQLQTALELYFSEYRAYPNSGGGNWIRITGTDTLSNTLRPIYINAVPIDPQQTGTDANPCSNVNNRRYNYRSSGTYYNLTAIMAVSTSNDESTCNSLNTWSNACGATYPTQDFCYGVESP